jgi:hypothetical protein
MRNSKLHIVSVAAAIAAGLAVGGTAAPAAAAPAHCFDQFGQPTGPTYDSAQPNPDWIAWVRNHGGTCRVLSGRTPIYRGVPESYPREYTEQSAPPPPAGPLRSQPPTTEQSVWLGNPARAAALVAAAYARDGRPAAQITDTARVVYRPDGVWRVFDVHWAGGRGREIAVNMKPDGEYSAMEADGAEGWMRPFPLGR